MTIGYRMFARIAIPFHLLAVLALALGATGCASKRTPEAHPGRVSPAAGNAAPAPGAGSAEVAKANEAALLAARAHAAASVRARQEGDLPTAAREEAAARAALEAAGQRSADVDLVDLLPEDFEAEPSAEEGAEPAPFDEIAGDLPEFPAEDLERDRALVESGPAVFDFPMEVNPRVLSYVEYFTTRHRDRFGESIVRSGMYLDMIQRIFEEAGIPRDLAYMAHVESAFKVTAYSRAKARGVFQFISETGRRYGLRIDGWVDERADAEKATHAAAAYLKDLYGMFGDWYLALAAYNTGEGRIQRALNRLGPKTFWQLADARALHPETKNYVPAILAATLIAKEPERYGFDVVPAPALGYDTIPVEGAVDLRTLARLSGTDFDTMKLLNPQFRRQATPPRETSMVRLPVGTGPATLTALAELPADQRLVQVQHKVRKGESWTGIARRYGVSVAEIRQENGLRAKSALKAGSVLRIPVAAAPGQPGEVRTASTAKAKTKAKTRSAEVTGTTATYRVRPGDTLAAIARRYGTTPRAIANASGIGLNSTIQVGQKLRIPGADSSATVRHREAAPGGRPAEPAVHTVRRGESLYAIANRYRMTVDEICALNDLNPGVTIYPGTRLTVRSN